MTAVGRGVLLAEGEGRRVGVGSDLMTVKGDGQEDRFSIVEYEAAAGAPGPPPHVHHSNEEGFYILEGSVDFMLDGKTARLTEGGFVLVPPEVRHTFVNAGSGLARWVGIFSPGHYRQLVEELGALMPASGPPDAAEVAALFARYDTEIVEA
jgi:mannose-6-phosphate isomerase-like protein (cupin superfamily)